MPTSVFLQSVASRPSSVPGSPISFDPELNLQGLPGMSGPQGAMLQMILSPLLQQLLGPGFVPGQFSPTHNLYDFHRRRIQFQQMQQSMNDASAMDRQNMLRMVHGMGNMAGMQWTPERLQAAEIIATDMNRLSPMMAQTMPGLFDQMMGRRGSSAVMAQGMFSGGRYRFDPITGAYGMSPQSVTAMTQQVYERLYGPGADLAAMRGIGAGSAGMLFDEMTRRGYMPRALSREEQIRGIATQDLRGRGFGEDRIQRELGSAMDELNRLASPQLENRIRQFEANRVAERIRGLSGAVSAMRDIFGEIGRSDAPMSELIEGLQVLTQGGLSQMSPARLEQLARDINNTSRITGVGMDNMTAMSGAASQRAEQMGLNRVFGVTAARESAVFGAAYAATAGGPAWGRGDRDRITAIDAQLRLNAANSPAANLMAATYRTREAIGGFRAGSEAEALHRAIEERQTTYSYGGQTRSIHQPDRWREIMVAGGASASLASAFRGQTAYNQRFIDQHNLTGLARNLQSSVDAAPRIGQAYRMAARRAGITDAGLQRRIGELASQGLLRELSPEQLQDQEAVAGFLADRLGIDRGDATRMAQLRQTATLGWGNLEQRVARDRRMRGFRSADQFVMANRYDTAQMANEEERRIRADSNIQSALSGLGQSPLRRIADLVMTAQPGTSVREIAARAIGWFPSGASGTALQGSFDQLQQAYREYRNPAGTTSQERAQARQRALERIRRLTGILNQQADRAGLDFGPQGQGRPDPLLAQAAAGQALQALQGLPGGFGASLGGLALTETARQRARQRSQAQTASGAGALAVLPGPLGALMALGAGGPLGAMALPRPTAPGATPSSGTPGPTQNIRITGTLNLLSGEMIASGRGGAAGALAGGAGGAAAGGIASALG